MHHLPVDEAVALLHSDADRGLSDAQARRRLQRHGPNVLPRVERRGPLLHLALQFHHPLIYVLLVAAAVTCVVGAPVDASVIVGVLLANAAIGFVQEARAERALDALAAMVTVDARVIRDGTERRVRLASSCRGTSCCWPPATRSVPMCGCCRWSIRTWTSRP
jgi:magnesium-transporting ATPase (P-type)